MSTVINTNLASLYAQNNLSGAQNNLAQSVMRLSSGLRINSAKDDAAGLAISQNMQGQINSVNQSVRNLNDATNLIQVADTAMSTIQDMLLRIKQLATQGYDGSLSLSQKNNIMDEIAQLNTEINNTATRTKFNGNQLINASVGVDSTSTGKVGAVVTASKSSITNVNVGGAAGTAGGTTYTLGYTGTTLTLTGNGASQSITAAQQSGLTSLAVGAGVTLNFDRLGISLTVVNGGTSTDTDVGTNLNTKTIVVTGSTPTLDFQAGADTMAGNLISYQTINVQTNASNTGSNSQMTQLGTQISLTQSYTNGTVAANQATQATAFNTLGSRVDDAINFISDQRSVMGALINRISYISQNLQAQSTNLQSSRSAIVDTDFAAETAKLTKGQIMQQAATAMLAQANQMPNVVLSLLK